MLDTSVIADIERNKRATLLQLEALSFAYPAKAHISFITYFEMLLGYKNKKPNYIDFHISRLQSFNCLAATQRTAEILASLRQEYDAKGEVFSLSDLIIAAQAIEHAHVLLTKDKQFGRIRELRCKVMEHA